MYGGILLKAAFLFPSARRTPAEAAFLSDLLKNGTRRASRFCPLHFSSFFQSFKHFFRR